MEMYEYKDEWVDIVFIQDWDSHKDEYPETPEWGNWEEMVEYLSQWDYGHETDYAHTTEYPQRSYTGAFDIEFPWGLFDDLYEFNFGGMHYYLSINSHLRYAGLQRRPLNYGLDEEGNFIYPIRK